MKQQILPQLVSRTAAGDNEAFEQLITSQNPLILWTIRGMTDSHEDAEDIRQEVVIRVFQNIASLRNPEAFVSWLRKIVVNECMRHFTARKRSVPVEALTESEDLLIDMDKDCMPFDSVASHEFATAFGAALRTLPETVQKIFSMRYGFGMRCREIAVYMDMSASSVSVTLFRAREHLKAQLYAGGLIGV